MNDDNNSTRKMRIDSFRKPDNTRWIGVTFLKFGEHIEARWIPSFLDLHRIIQAIAECEDEKYPPPLQGRSKLAHFLHEAVFVQNFETLAREFRIPIRDGDRIVKTNGAAVRTDGTGPSLSFELPPE